MQDDSAALAISESKLAPEVRRRFCSLAVRPSSAPCVRHVSLATTFDLEGTLRRQSLTSLTVNGGRCSPSAVEGELEHVIEPQTIMVARFEVEPEEGT